MSVRAKKSFAWLWIATLLTATIGISVQQIYCYCMGKTSFSVFNTGNSACASGTSDEKDCCRIPPAKPACCEKDATGADDGHGCTHTTIKVFQLKTEFVVDKPFEKSLDCPLWLEDFPMFRHFTRPVICAASPLPPPLSPPPLSGREICLRHQVSLC